ncbi:HD family hydrolase [Symbiopectobacterium purcellii]|uniref:HD family hydrolase n=1 Tax=Symbiopectobacterium purcellii TaxID=2871826 RepID=UPI003F86A5D2
MTWISTFTGRHFNYNAPSVDDVDIRDIAHALSQINRFCGHTHWPYSVAQHSIGASYLVPHEFAFEALMHDAHEAYVSDMMSSLKHLLPDYQRIETDVEVIVRLRYGLPLKMSAEVKRADLIMLATEKDALLHPDSGHWPILDGVERSERIIVPMSAFEAEREFMTRFSELAGPYVDMSYEGMRHG